MFKEKIAINSDIVITNKEDLWQSQPSRMLQHLLRTITTDR
jgi:hypothetical protein